MDIHSTCNCDQKYENAHKRANCLPLLQQEKIWLKNNLQALRELHKRLSKETQLINDTLEISRKYSFALNHTKPTVTLEVAPQLNTLTIRCQRSSHLTDESRKLIQNSDSLQEFWLSRIETYKNVLSNISNFVNRTDLLMEENLKQHTDFKKLQKLKQLHEQYLMSLTNRSKISYKFMENVKNLAAANDHFLKQLERQKFKRGTKLITLMLQQQDKKVTRLENNIKSLEFSCTELKNQSQSTKTKDELSELKAELKLAAKNVLSFETERSLKLTQNKAVICEIAKTLEEIKRDHLSSQHSLCDCLTKVTSLRNRCNWLNRDLHETYTL